MSEIQRGAYTLNIVDNTGQWEIISHYGGETYRIVNNGSRDERQAAKDVFDLLNAYLLLFPTKSIESDGTTRIRNLRGE